MPIREEFMRKEPLSTTDLEKIVVGLDVHRRPGNIHFHSLHHRDRERDCTTETGKGMLIGIYFLF